MPDERSRRIAKNTAMLYVRMIFIMFVSLYTSRVVLSTLGVSDYGVYNVVGGVVYMFSFLNAAMTNGTQRFLSYELGRGDISQLRKMFSITLSIHIFIGLVIVILAETIGLWFLNTQLNIPAERMMAANWVYQFSILSFLISVIQVPYNSLIIAHERMNVYAYVSIIEVILRLLVVFILTQIDYDKLTLYGFLYFSVTLIAAVIYAVYCKIKFSECTSHFVYDHLLFKRLLSFAGWNLYGNVTCVVAAQGVNLILNIFFGPVINAARGIAYQISSSIYGFANNFQMAVNPQIIKSYAAGENEYMMNLIFRSAKFSFYLLFIIALPIFIEVDFILKIWLKVVPEYTSLFCRLIIISGLLDVFSGPLQTAANATGKIKLYQFTEGTIILLLMPLSYLLYKLGFAPQATFYVGILISIALQFARLMILRGLIHVDMKHFVMDIFFKSLFVGFLASLIPFMIKDLYVNEVIRFFVVCFFSVVSSFTVIYFLGLNRSEKIFVKEKMSQIYTKLERK
ncbi:Na+-driven multidrug efflux pump [Bacteroides luti]|jgi:O-antigen/teichoic acid export membrane protein|uniref:Na+-driven multidrug efflux pump n=1 Tax=Bacteroides luti TaxID=1297750 RepID=A0A1M4W9M9_9BACE|nr:MATE family efflux transporter [Bacteroides luti]SHE77968.1 Na+-driven multidrug efflux pump [Bacteroides luti]